MGRAPSKTGASRGIPACCGGTGNVLGSEKLGAEVGRGGWSCSACPGGTEESGEPWGMDLEWEGWAGRWKVLERDRQTQTELGAAEMWEELWSRALSCRIEELGRLKAPREKLGRCCPMGKLSWSPGGSLGRGKGTQRDTSFGVHVLLLTASLLCGSCHGAKEAALPLGLEVL